MEKANRLLEKFNNVKTLPQVAIQLSRLISDENSNMHDFEEMIRMDPTLVVRLLRLVNSSYYGLEQKVENISRAVVFIGMRNLRNMIVTEALKDIFSKESHSSVFSKEQLWLHCTATSICGQMITERIFGQKGENAFLCGMLHDVGMIVENQVEEELFIQICGSYQQNGETFTDYEKTLMGTDHCEVGYLLARDWNVPEEVQEGIKHHHDRLEDVSPSSVTGINQIATYIVTKMKSAPITGMDAEISPPLAEHIKEYMDEYKALAKDLPEEMAKASELYESKGDERDG
jgi:putative nucleotidyltransferase with HDIG domain